MSDKEESQAEIPTKPLTPKEQAVKDCISIVRTFCGEEMRRNNYLPPDQAVYRGNFITVFESDLVNQLKNLLK